MEVDMEYKGVIKQSRTLDLGALVVVLGAIQTGLPQISSQLGEYNGIINMAVGVLIVYLRYVTKGPVGQK
jgi:hypothetical protein